MKLHRCLKGSLNIGLVIQGVEAISALKVIASPNDLRFINYNRAYKEGREVEGENFYKIDIGMNFDYSIVNEEGFSEFIKTINKDLIEGIYDPSR